MFFECAKQKKRKKTILKDSEQCLARKQDGMRCSRRKKKDKLTNKYSDFCGKHQSGVPFGRIDDLKLEGNFFKTLEKDTSIKVKDDIIDGKEYLIDYNNIVYNKEGTLILGKKRHNKLIQFPPKTIACNA